MAEKTIRICLQPLSTPYMTVSRIFVNNLHNYMSVQTRGNIHVNYKYLDVINNADLRKRNFEIMCLH